MSTTKSTFPIASILGLIFITLKLTNFITWSWWWVLSPFWIPISFIVMLFVVIGALTVLVKK